MANPEATGLSRGRIVGTRETAGSRLRPLTAEPAKAWRAIGWFGALIATVAFVDLLLNVYPPAFGSPEWEFGTISGTMASLPLFSIGIAAVLGSFLARGQRVGILCTAGLMLLLGLLIVAGLALFGLDVPLAMKATAGGVAALVVKKSIVRTLVMGLGFGTGYLVAAIASIRYATKRRST